jgi:SNF2 family DNA or RNA helicase
MTTVNLKPDEAYIELSENVDRIEVFFRYNEQYIKGIKTIKGRHWNKEARYWSVPMEMKAARQLREVFGDNLKLGPALRLWAKEQNRVERNLRQLNAATDAKLERTPKVILDVIAGRPIEHPSIPPKHALRRKRPARPYQRADIKMMSLASAINANDVGTGKTLEVIGALYEGGIAPKPVLVVAPRRTLVNVWQTEFSRLSEYGCWTSEFPSLRHRYMQDLVDLHSTGDLYSDKMACAVALIADDLRIDKYRDVKDPYPETGQDPLHACNDYRGNWYKFKNAAQRDFFKIDFGAFVIDEFHNTGLPNRKSLFHLSAQLIKTDFKWPMSGTPIGGKPRRLWPILNFLDKKQYASEWRWIEDWLEVTEDKIYVKGGRGAQRTVKTVGGIREGMEEKFFDHHRMHMVRRTKKDALPGLPDAVEILVETPMSGKQLNDYKVFDEDHEIMLDGKRLSGSIVLAQYTRLRQMANSRLTFPKGDDTKPVAHKDSNKLDYLLERLDENGIRKTDYEPGARAYIGVLDKSFLTVVIDFLKKNGIDTARLDGDTKDSRPMLTHFADGTDKPFVIAMTIQTGGTGLNLEDSNSAHALDEAWDPDVMHQFFGRGDRGSRDKPLRCYTYRTPHSIQEYVAKVAGDKQLNNKTVLNYVKEIEALRTGR